MVFVPAMAPPADGAERDPVELRRACLQLAFLLLNVESLTDLTHEERTDPVGAIADLLWFPTGGGKTEAYLGLAAFTLVLRRLRNPGFTSAGVSVLMRYTLRLLTLDQLSRASALVCALEIERLKEIKSYAPGISHVVVDARVFKPS